MLSIRQKIQQQPTTVEYSMLMRYLFHLVGLFSKFLEAVSFHKQVTHEYCVNVSLHYFHCHNVYLYKIQESLRRSQFKKKYY